MKIESVAIKSIMRRLKVFHGKNLKMSNRIVEKSGLEDLFRAQGVEYTLQLRNGSDGGT